MEITNLLIPGYNDDMEEIKQMCEWIKTHCGAETPLHFSRYFPCYKMSLPPTPVGTLKTAEKIAREKLKFVYLGNV